MWSRPVRQTTAHSLPADGDTKVLVYRNELNEQQRPGSLVLIAEKDFKNWTPKLIRSMKPVQEGNNAAVESDGLLLYSGSYIRLNKLDKQLNDPGMPQEAERSLCDQS